MTEEPEAAATNQDSPPVTDNGTADPEPVNQSEPPTQEANPGPGDVAPGAESSGEEGAITERPKLGVIIKNLPTRSSGSLYLFCLIINITLYDIVIVTMIVSNYVFCIYVY